MRFFIAPTFLLISCVVAAAPGVPAGAKLSRGMTVSATAYCQSGTTASGEQTRPGIVAADPRVIPLGTRLHIHGLRQPDTVVYKVSDTGSAVKGREIDIYMPSCRDAIQFGRQRLQVRMVGD